MPKKTTSNQGTTLNSQTKTVGSSHQQGNNRSSNAPTVVFYDAIGHIGGNKIAIKSAGGKAILLDFGLNFGIGQTYLNEYLKLRTFSYLHDGFCLEELPISKGLLAGIYNPDLFEHQNQLLETKFGAIGGDPQYITDVLISHPHADHIGEIYQLHWNIGLVCSESCHTVLKYLEHVQSGNSNLTGLFDTKRQFVESIDKNGKKTRPTKCDVIDRRITPISTGTVLKLANECFEVQCYDVDHSIPGAAGYLIKDLHSGRKFVYTGDWRFHGSRKEWSEQFLQKAKEFEPDVLIIEGTRVSDRREDYYFPTETAVLAEISRRFVDIQAHDGQKLIMFDCSIRDLWRLNTIYQASIAIDRIPVFPAKAFELIRECNSLLPEPIDLARVKCFLPKKGWGIYDDADYSRSPDLKWVFSSGGELDLNKPFKITSEDIKQHPEKYVVMMPFYSMMEMLDIDPPAESYYLWSKSEYFDDEGEIEWIKVENWLTKHQIPKDNIHFFEAHCSGHATAEQIEHAIQEIHPKVVFPIHTEKPDLFQAMILGEIKVICPEKEKEYQIDEILK